MAITEIREYIEKTYSELNTLKSGSNLIPGQQYKITDYRTTYNQPITDIVMSGSIEPLIVTAIGSGSLDTLAYSEDYTDDHIYYDFDDNTCIDTITPRTGFIFKRVDTKRSIDICYDWRKVKFRRYTCNQTDWAPGTYSEGDIRKVSGSGVYASLENSNSDDPTGVTTKWTKIVDLQYWNYWGYDSGIIDNVSFDATDYVDVYTFCDVQDLTNSSGEYVKSGTDGQFRNIFIEGLNQTRDAYQSRYPNQSDYIYLNNVIYYDTVNITLDRLIGHYHDIRFSGAGDLDEGDEYVANNTFWQISNVHISGYFLKNVISNLCFDIHKSTIHAIMQYNYICDFVQSFMSEQSNFNQNKINNFNNNSLIGGSFTGLIADVVNQNKLLGGGTANSFCHTFVNNLLYPYASINNIDNTCTHIQANYTCILTRNSNSDTILQYIDEYNATHIVDPGS